MSSVENGGGFGAVVTLHCTDYEVPRTVRMLLRERQERWIGHRGTTRGNMTGTTIGFNADMAYHPEDRMAFIVLANLKKPREADPIGNLFALLKNSSRFYWLLQISLQLL